VKAPPKKHLRPPTITANNTTIVTTRSKLRLVNYAELTNQALKAPPPLTSTAIGMNLWLTPQISLHCP
jgi:hypothetical protein